ncbi:alpha/beta hydrolase [Streptomyces sp. Li-HN-5-11]|uniref:alpha/beta fold hydrolase n=1 Tax=Streptomyces sp. Li-HN-5-11 TaxID=3075432 RepID=UPI0028ACBA99|nr:alpha/beta hydrolase [Streptomyces sp. Li-HN-5-11]WNM34766.1 alpha/beta hydrolase [Streptomyces sp. Li-HN-5-11]
MPQEVTAEGTSRSVRTRDWKIHYNEAGEGHPVVMLHGSGPGATGWSNFGPNIKVLADRFRVIAPDMPGWGESDAVLPEKRDHVQAAVQLLDELGIEKAAFVGNSMGGMTSIKLASEYPDRISHLITMGAGGPGPALFTPGGGVSEGLKILLRTYEDPSPEGMRALIDVMTYNPAFASEELVRQRSDAARAHPDHLSNFISAFPTGMAWSTAEEVATIRTPTLLLHGRDDRVMPAEASLRLLSLIPDSRLVLINRCGHWLQLEHADEFNRLLADFVSSR